MLATWNTSDVWPHRHVLWGPRYQELTQRVIDCDFGYGKDLKRPQLQEAMYNKVLVELESMIASLDISQSD